VKSTDVKLWDVRRNKSSKTPSYEIRWVVGGRAHSKTRRTKALADSFLSDLRQAAKDGQEFGVEIGLPESMLQPEPVPSQTFLAFAQAYIAKRWPHAAAKSRDAMSDALATVIPALTKDIPGRPDAGSLRTALRKYALLPGDKRPEPSPEIASATRWLESASLTLPDLKEAKVVHSALDALTLRMDGQRAGANTIRRKRAVLHHVLEYAVELDELPSNPLHKVKWKPPETTQTVDPRVAVNPVQARELLIAATYVGKRGRGRRLAAMFACMYYVALRPGETIGLRQGDCYLPEEGWGRITLSKSRPEVNTQWTDTGDAHAERGLKHRAADDVRVIPIPPVLVKILREHIKEFGVALDGRLFRSERGKPVASTAYTEVWAQARTLALTPDQVASPLAGRPYDLRHAAVSLWLNGGVSPTEIAKRAGHSVEVLLRVYAKCVHGQEEIANHRIEEILAPERV